MQNQSPEELVEKAEQAMAARDPATALALLGQAETMSPATERTRMLRAVALRATGNVVGALAALDDLLAEQPYHFIALLSKGVLLDLAGSQGAAIDVYRNVIKIAPPEDKLPASALKQLAVAKTKVADHDRALEAYLLDAVSEIRRDFSATDLRRFDEALSIFSGVTKAYVQDPLLLHYPQLPAIPFYDRSLFPWLEQLEAASNQITDEMVSALTAATADQLAPYIQYPKGAPVNQWKDLNNSTNWTSYFLWKDGTLQDAAVRQCPATLAVLDSLPLADQPGFAPTAVFSVLQAHTHIPPHTGSTNVRLLCHLPLLLPGPARFRVGNETRDWRMGEAWVFDDTIEHEAWNDADSQRVILILDVWNPLLSEAERALTSQMLSAYKRFMAEPAG